MEAARWRHLSGRFREISMNEPDMQMGRSSLVVKAFGISDTGRVRPSNEDQFLIAELTKTMRIWQTSLPEPKAQFGERARSFVSRRRRYGRATVPANRPAPWPSLRSSNSPSIRFKWFFQSDKPEAQTALKPVSDSAPRGRLSAIVEESSEHAELSGMGTTVDSGISSRRPAMRRPRRR